jgi:flagellar M-ring protein FliF
MAPPSNGPTQQGSTNTTSATTNFAVSKSTTNTAIRIPRLLKLSVAVIVDGVDGKPRSPEEVARLLASAQAAVGYDAARGDQFELSSQPFKPIPDGVEAPVIAATPVWVYAAIAGAVLAVVIATFVLARRGAKAKEVAQTLVLQPGATVAALEAKQNAIDGVAVEQKKQEPPLLVDPLQDLKEKARAMVRADPERAVMLVRAWLSADLEKGIDNG